ncbi:UNVERIFIED_CONTAM: sporulation protein, partial [Bacillus amyloliquefaciens DSM 7 = ATCC 23350]
YLRASLSNHLVDKVWRGIYNKLQVKHYANEGEFAEDLHDLEMDAFNQVHEKEINYAENEQAEKRTMELHEVYELLL